MKVKRTTFTLILLMTFLIAACGSAPAADEAMMENPDQASMTEEAMDSEEDAEETMMEEKPSEEAMMESPAWFSAALTDVRTGQTFSIQDFKGKVVLVEAMAVWCSKCLQQQKQVQALHGLIGERDDFVSIGLDIDPNEDAAKLKGFIESQGFDWLYAVSSAGVSRDLSSLYGANFLNPPSTPMLVVDRKGMVDPLPFGIKSADELLQFIQPFLEEGM
jgi:thiol-disulfide isomerase/thioredoxin